MVEITNGANTYKVTRSAYESIFRAQGYKLIDSARKSILANPSNAVGDSAMSSEDEKLLEKPIASWTKSEVKAFAARNDISLVGTKNVNEAKGIIRDWINENL